LHIALEKKPFIVQINSSYLVWQPIWRGLFGIDASWPLTQQIAVLQTQLREIDPNAAARIPLLSQVLDLAIPENDLTRSLDPKLRNTLLQTLLVDCLRARALKKALLIVLEACQWLDPLSYELLEAVALAIEDLPVVLVCTYRLQDEETRARVARANALPYYHEVPIPALTAAEAAHFIHLKVAQLLGRRQRCRRPCLSAWPIKPKATPSIWKSC
jgi:hypothetical protein